MLKSENGIVNKQLAREADSFWGHKIDILCAIIDGEVDRAKNVTTTK